MPCRARAQIGLSTIKRTIVRKLEKFVSRIFRLPRFLFLLLLPSVLLLLFLNRMFAVSMVDIRAAICTLIVPELVIISEKYWELQTNSILYGFTFIANISMLLWTVLCSGLKRWNNCRLAMIMNTRAIQIVIILFLTILKGFFN